MLVTVRCFVLNWTRKALIFSYKIAPLIKLRFVCFCFIAASCADIQKRGNSANGVYAIYPTDVGEIKVYCDLQSAGGGWTVSGYTITLNITCFFGEDYTISSCNEQY